jgi:hypothetical protein
MFRISTSHIRLTILHKSEILQVQMAFYLQSFSDSYTVLYMINYIAIQRIDRLFDYNIRGQYI